MGRLKQPKNLIRSKILQLYLTEDERNAIHQFATDLSAERGVSIKASTYFRNLIMKHIKAYYKSKQEV